MSTPRITLPDISGDENADLNRLLENLGRKSQINKTLAAYYDAEKNLRMAHGGVVPPQYYRLGLVLGWTAKAVDVLARRCHLDGMVWPDGDLESLGYRELWDGNRLGSETSQGITSGLIHAVTFVTAARGDGPDEPEVMVHFHDASDATGDWNARSRRLDNLVVVNGRDDDGHPDALTLYLPGRTVTAWRTLARWSTEVSEHSFGVPAAPLAYKPRLKRRYGRSRISRPLRAIQDAAARSLVRLEGHSDIYSYPEFWMLGADPSIFKNSDGTPTDRFQQMLGRIKGIPDDPSADPALARADVKKFSAESPQPHLATLNAQAKLFAREAAMPDTALAITDFANPTSAESYDASQYELIAEAEGATDEWSAPLRDVIMIALAMQNGETEVPEGWRSIDTKWRDPRYQSRAAQADAGSKQLAAAPWLAETEVGLELLGMDEQQVRRALGEQRRARLAGALAGLTDVADAADSLEGA